MEHKIASLEVELNATQSSGVLPDDIPLGSTHAKGTLSTQNVHDFLARFAQLSHPASRNPTSLASQVADSLRSPSILPHCHSSMAGIADSGRPRSTTAVGLEAIPSHVANMLFKVYLERILPQYPFFSAKELLQHRRNAYDPQSQSSVSSFIVSMTMAVSTMTSKSPDFQKTISLSDSLFRSAMLHYEKMPPNSMDTLQCTMLICQYVCIPRYERYLLAKL